MGRKDLALKLETHCLGGGLKCCLRGGFKYFLFYFGRAKRPAALHSAGRKEVSKKKKCSPLFGEIIQFDK